MPSPFAHGQATADRAPLEESAEALTSAATALRPAVSAPAAHQPSTAPIRHIAYPLLPQPVATSVSNIVSATRLSIKAVDVLATHFFDLSSLATRATLQTARDLLLPVPVPTATVTRTTSVTGPATDSTAIQIRPAVPPSTMSHVANAMHGLLSLAETVSLGALSVTSKVTSRSIRLADEIARIIDGVFGSTDTSFALRAFVELLDAELMQSGPGESPSPKFLSLSGPIDLAKAVCALTCLQMQSRDRHLERVKMEHMFSLILPADSEYNVDLAADDDDTAHSQADFLNNLDTVVDSEDACDATAAVLTVATGGVNDDVIPTATQPPSSLVDQVDGRLNIKWSTVAADDAKHPSKPFHTSPAHLLARLRTYSKYATAVYGHRFMQMFRIANYASPSAEYLCLDAHGRLHHPHHRIFSQHASVPLHCIIASTHHQPAKIIHRHLRQHNLQIRTPTMHVPNYVLSVDHAGQAVCVTIRGTLGLSDLLTNATCSYSPVELNGQVHQVHAGMLQQALWLSTDRKFFDTLRQALLTWHKYSLVLVGHSMAAGVATLLGVLWCDRIAKDTFVVSSTSGLPAGRAIHVYAFAPACVVSLALSKECQGLVTSTVHGKDVIPSLSLGSARDMRDVLRFLYKQPAEEKSTSQPLSSDQLSLLVLKNAVYGTANRSIIPCQSPVVAVKKDGPMELAEDLRRTRLRTMPFGFHRRTVESSASEPLEKHPDNNQQHLQSEAPEYLSTVAVTREESTDTDSKEEEIGAGAAERTIQSNGETTLAATDSLDDWFDGVVRQCSGVMTNEKLYVPGDVYWIHSDLVSVPTAYVGKESPSRSRQNTVSQRSLRSLSAGDQPAWSSSGSSSSSPSLRSADPTEQQHQQQNWVQTRRVMMSKIVNVEQMFNEIVFSRSMMMDHSPGRMEWCLDALDKAAK